MIQSQGGTEVLAERNAELAQVLQSIGLFRTA